MKEEDIILFGLKVNPIFDIEGFIRFVFHYFKVGIDNNVEYSGILGELIY